LYLSGNGGHGAEKFIACIAGSFNSPSAIMQLEGTFARQVWRHVNDFQRARRKRQISLASNVKTFKKLEVLDKQLIRLIWLLTDMVAYEFQTGAEISFCARGLVLELAGISFPHGTILHCNWELYIFCDHNLKLCSEQFQLNLLKKLYSLYLDCTGKFGLFSNFQIVIWPHWSRGFYNINWI
jgi:hypothetical protein